MIVSPQLFICFVGADSSTERLGIKSPIFDDGSFEYIPIPEKDVSDPSCPHLVRYKDLVLRSGLHISEFIPLKRLNNAVHYDPEFITNTYGDYVNKPRAMVLRRVREGDYIFFLSRLSRWKNGRFTGEVGHYIIGFFEVEKVLKGIPRSLHFSVIEEFKNNAHVRRCLCGKEDFDAWIFKGSRRSRLLDKAVPFTIEIASQLFNIKQKPGRSVLQIIASHLRVCRLIEESKSQLFLEYIERHAGKIL